MICIDIGYLLEFEMIFLLFLYDNDLMCNLLVLLLVDL